MTSSGEKDIGDEGQLIRDCTELRRRLVLTEESLRRLDVNSPNRPRPEVTFHETKEGESDVDSLDIESQRKSGNDDSELIIDDLQSLEINEKEIKHRTDTPSSTRPNSSTYFHTPRSRLRGQSLQDKTERSTYDIQMEDYLIQSLQTDAKEKDFQIRYLYGLLNSKNLEIEELKLMDKDKDEALTKEQWLRKSLEEKLEESLLTGEEMQGKLVDFKEYIQIERETNSQSMDMLKNEASQLKELVEARNLEVENLRNVNDSIREENEALASELEEQNTLIDDLKSKLNSIKEKNSQLKAVNKEQEMTNEQLEKNVEEARMQISSLEKLIEKVQQETVIASAERDRLDKELDRSGKLKEPHKQTKSDPKKDLPADIELKLAMKDAEIGKLQAAMLSRSTASLGSSIGHQDESVFSSSGIRSEFSNILERNRMGQQKQQDMERVISHLQDEIARYADQIMVLEERLTDKLSYISMLEGKSSQKNAKLSSFESEIKRLKETNAKIEMQLELKELNLHKLAEEFQSNKESLIERTSQTEKLETLVDEKMQLITQLEEMLHDKFANENQNNKQMEEMKHLHSQQCNELTAEIDKIAEDRDEKALQISTFEARFTVLEQELGLKTSLCHDLEGRLDETTTNLEERSSKLLSYEEKLKKLSNQLKLETDKVESLDLALSNCKEELKLILEQAQKTQEKYSDELKGKDLEVQKAEQNTEMIMVELHGKTNMLNETQSTLVEKDKEIDQEKRKMAELEQKIVEMQGDQEATGDRFAQERNELAEKLHTMTCDFKSVSSKLEMAQKENDHLKTAFIKVQTEFVQKKNENEELRKAFQQNFLELKSKESELAETKSSHKVLSEKYQELRKKSVEIERKRKDAEGKALQLENELTAVHTELKKTMDDLLRLERLLSDNKKEIQEKEEMLSQMDRKLNDSQEDSRQKEVLLVEQNLKLKSMDKNLKEQQMELRQKSLEVTQLDMSLKEQQSHLQQQLGNTETHLMEVKRELEEKVIQIAELEARVEFTEEKLELKLKEINNLKETTTKLTSGNKELTSKLAELLKVEELSRSLQDRCWQMSNELENSRKWEQNMLHDFQALQTELDNRRRNEENLTKELDNCHLLLESKEADCTRLAKDLGSTQLREAQGKLKWEQELQKVRQQMEFKISRQDREANEVSKEHTKKLAATEKKLVMVRAKLQQTNDEKEILKNDLQRSQNRLTEQDEDIRNLNRQLQIQQQQSNDINEHLLIKDAEITRLEARVSKYERSSFEADKRTTKAFL